MTIQLPIIFIREYCQEKRLLVPLLAGSPFLIRQNLKRYVVVSIDPVNTKDRECQFQMVDVEIVDEEYYDEHLIVRSHLGAKLREGCVVLCYDRRGCALNESVEQTFKKKKLPDVIIACRANTNKKKKFRVKEITPHCQEHDDEFNGFMEDLQDDKELRQDVPVYKDGTDEIATEKEIEEANKEE